MLLTWELVSRAGAWYTVSEDLVKIAKDIGVDMPEKFQGENAVFEFVEANENLTKTLHKYFINIIAENSANEV